MAGKPSLVSCFYSRMFRLLHCMLDGAPDRLDALVGDIVTALPDSLIAVSPIHPNTTGYARMAGVWYDAISGYLP